MPDLAITTLVTWRGQLLSYILSQGQFKEKPFFNCSHVLAGGPSGFLERMG